MLTSKRTITADEFREAFAVAIAPTNPPPKPMTDDKRYTLLLVQNTAESEAELLKVLRQATAWGAKNRKPVKVRIATYEGGVTLDSVVIAAPIFNEFADALVAMYEGGAVYQLDFFAHEIKPIKPAVPLAEGNTP